MRKLNIAIIVAGIAGTVALAAYSYAQQSPATTVTIYFTTPLENDPARVVRVHTVSLPPGSGNNFHRHPGDQWAAIQEGEVTLTIKGEAPRVLKAGESVYLPRGNIHRNQNLSDKPARSVEVNVLDKGRPNIEWVPD